MKRLTPNDTIAAIATPAGRGGVGIIRLSGPDALAMARRMTGDRPLLARQAHFRRFRDGAGEVGAERADAGAWRSGADGHAAEAGAGAGRAHGAAR